MGFSMTSTILLLLSVLYVPTKGYYSQKSETFSVDAQVVSAVLGRPVTLPCRVDFLDSSSQIIWDKNTDVIATNKKAVGEEWNRRSIGGGEGGMGCGERCFDLTLFETKIEDEGQYRCQVLSKYQQLYKLVVQVPPALVSFSPASTYILLNLGTENFALNCSFHSKPPALVTWYKEDVELQAGEKVAGNSSSYILKNVTKETEGRYSCQADNGYGEAALHHFNVSVAYPPEIIQISGDFLINTGENVSLTCMAKSNPSPIIRWFKEKNEEEDEDEFGADDDYMFEHKDFYLDHHVLLNGHTATSHLPIINTTTASVGRYVCKASNSQSFTVQGVNVRGKPTELTITSDYETESCCTYLLTWSVLSAAPLLHLQIVLEKMSAVTIEYSVDSYKVLHIPDLSADSPQETNEAHKYNDVLTYNNDKHPIQNPYYHTDVFKPLESYSEHFTKIKQHRPEKSSETHFESYENQYHTDLHKQLDKSFDSFDKNYEDVYNKESSALQNHNFNYNQNSDISRTYSGFDYTENQHLKEPFETPYVKDNYKDGNNYDKNDINIHKYSSNHLKHRRRDLNSIHADKPRNNRTITVALGRTNAYKVRDLEADTEYRIIIRVGNVFGYSYWTDYFKFKTSLDTPLQADESYSGRNTLRSSRHGTKNLVASKTDFQYRSSALGFYYQLSIFVIVTFINFLSL